MQQCCSNGDEIIVLNDQGGAVMSVSYDLVGTCSTCGEEVTNTIELNNVIKNMSMALEDGLQVRMNMPKDGLPEGGIYVVFSRDRANGMPSETETAYLGVDSGYSQ